MIWPNIPFKQCDFSLERNVRSFSSGFNSHAQQADYGGAYWQAEVELAYLSRREAGEVMGLLAAHGRSGILLPDAPHAEPVGVGGGEPVTVGNNQGGTVNISGAPQNTPAWLCTGDLVQIGNHLYLLTETVNTDRAGNATLNIQPYLRTVLAAGTPLKLSNCACLMQLEPKATLERRVTAGKRYLSSLKLKFVEVLR